MKFLLAMNQCSKIDCIDGCTTANILKSQNCIFQMNQYVNYILVKLIYLQGFRLIFQIDKLRHFLEVRRKILIPPRQPREILQDRVRGR